jgi:hypothetical protein
MCLTLDRGSDKHAQPDRRVTESTVDLGRQRRQPAQPGAAPTGPGATRSGRAARERPQGPSSNNADTGRITASSTRTREP